MSKKEIVKRYILLVISLFFSAFGVAVTKRGELGVSPISSVANVLGYRFTALSLGAWLIIWNCVLILAQILILRKKFKLIDLLQIPVSLLFGLFTDLGTLCVSYIPMNAYIARLAMVVAGTVILGFGISLSVIANVVMNPGEAFVRTVSDALGRKFGNVKIIFDVSCVVASVLLSLALFKGKLIGAREGTAIAAIFTGFVVKFFTRLLKNPLSKCLTGSDGRENGTEA